MQLAGESGSGTITPLFLHTATPGAPGEILRKSTINRLKKKRDLSEMRFSAMNFNR